MATTIKSLTVPARDKAEHDCHCGCSPCDGTCCSLDCIVKPRFFCGQLLTDADLSAMLKWARDRFGLSRYRHGWGVVCGLDVRCDPKAPTSISVTPGYAVNCCGDDIIVCETATLDLKGACREEEDPCADLRRERDSLASVKVGDKIGANIGDALGRKRGVSLSIGPRTGGQIFEEDMRVVDIYLSYTEQPTDPSTALGRSACKQTPECEYSRTRESSKLTWDFGVKGIDPMRTRADKWHKGYEKCLEVLTTFHDKFKQNFSAKDVRAWLLRWIDEHPQYQLCGLREGLCQADDDFFTTEKTLVQALFALVENCRNAYLQCECFGCDEDTRVPLARVWLAPDNGTTGQDCRIVAIDPYPPYRRPIQPECWPAPLGYVNVGRFIWHRWEEVCPASADLGLRVNFKKFDLPATLAELEKSLKCDLFIKCGDVRTALVFESGLLGSRVVGFCDDTGPAPPPPVCPTIVMDFQDKAPSGTLLTFSARLSPQVSAQFNWRVAGGTIAGGQGTPGITVHTEGLANEFVSATVDVSGLDPRCPPLSAVGQTFVTGEPQPPECPEILVKHPDQVQAGSKTDFEAILNPPVAGVTFNWSISAGTVTTGQGTPVITVDTTGLGGQVVTATVEIGKLDPTCKKTAEGRTRVTDQQCPEIVVKHADQVRAGSKTDFEAILNPPVAGVTFNWSISAGTVTTGQGTPVITVDTTGLGGQVVTATVEVGKLDPTCPKTKSETTRIVGKPVAIKVNEFLDTGDEREFTDALDDFALRLQQDPRLQGFIIVDGSPQRALAEATLRHARDFLINNRGIDASRVVAQLTNPFVTRGEFAKVELWIVPPGANPPTAVADALTDLDQIGEGRKKLLEDAGIKTFADMASISPDRLRELIPAVSEDTRLTWISEAKKRSG